MSEHQADDGTVRKDHYGSGRQPWDDIKDLGWAAEFAAGNVLKYLRRTKEPGHSLQSARWYLARLEEQAFTCDQSAEIYCQLLNHLTPEDRAKLLSL
jgi:hypothetical protein